MDHLPSVKTDQRYKDRLVEIHAQEDIPLELRHSPVEAFIMAQNFGWPVESSTQPEILVSTCIEYRYVLPIPRMYAYVIRRASGRLNGSEFTIGYCLSQGVRHIILIGHNDCGMTRAKERAPRLVDAFVNQGWSRESAQAYVDKHCSRYIIKDELDALEEEYLRLRSLFKKVIIAPLFVSLYDSKLYLPKFYLESLENPQTGSYRVSDDLVTELN